jgi:phosphoglucomutase
MELDPRAGRPAEPRDLVDVSKLTAAYYAERPDPAVPGQRVSFGTSGHRGSAFAAAFNEWHILAITQAICAYRKQEGIDGPLFLGIDTHALSQPAFETALEVLAANAVEVMIAADGLYTPTPAISHAILTHNRGRRDGLADGIVITPSHNPPEDGGFKYNPPHGGPAGEGATSWIEARANAALRDRLAGVSRVPLGKALAMPSTHRHDFLDAYAGDLGEVLDLEAVRGSGIRLGVDPLGGAGVHYWGVIAERYGLDLAVVDETVDPRFGFMTLDWDGRIRMDPSSPYAMRRLIGLKDDFDLAVACDTDHDRHGVVTCGAGLLPPNHYLAACVDYLLAHRPRWRQDVAVGKTVVTSAILDRLAARRGRRLYEVPVGFKWFVDGLLAGWLCFGGEESAGASFLRRDGTVWTTDKDGIVAALLAAEMTARLGRDPGESYAELTRELGTPVYSRLEAPATREQKTALAGLSTPAAGQDGQGGAPGLAGITELAGEPVRQVLTAAPGDGQPIGGIKVVAESGWFAARPSGTEEIYKIYAESFRGEEHLRRIEEEAQGIVARLFARGPG